MKSLSRNAGSAAFLLLQTQQMWCFQFPPSKQMSPSVSHRTRSFLLASRCRRRFQGFWWGNKYELTAPSKWIVTLVYSSQHVKSPKCLSLNSSVWTDVLFLCALYNVDRNLLWSCDNDQLTPTTFNPDSTSTSRGFTGVTISSPKIKVCVCVYLIFILPHHHYSLAPLTQPVLGSCLWRYCAISV